MFSYSGWNAAVYVAEEVREPSRNVPLGLAIGTLTVVALYLALNTLYLRVVPHAELSGTVSVGELAAARLFGPAAATMFAVVAIVIILSSMSAMTVAGPRMCTSRWLATAFLPAAARVHPKYRTPAVAIVGQAIWSAILVLSGHVRPAPHVHRLRDHSLLGARRALVILRPAPWGRHEDVSCVGLSVGAGGVQPRQVRYRRQHDRQRAASCMRGARGDVRWRAAVLVDEAQQVGPEATNVSSLPTPRG